VTTSARGTFDVQLHAMPMEDITKDSMLGRMSIDKQYHGELDGVAKGQMLTIGTPTGGSAVYVAVERITATLGGKRGSFAVHHTGIVSRGMQQLTITVAPDSGTGELKGITGTLVIEVKDGEHLYDLEYNL
jgi:hypothetical protein